jgi:uncharacterized protein YdaU (DUF1376 family)
MKPDSYIAFDWPKFHAATAGWSRQHKWSYWVAICAYYWQECAGLENCDDLLMAVCECAPMDWATTKARIFREGYFELGRDGRWHQKRAKREYEYAISLIQKKSEAGKLGAAARWGDNKPMADGMAEPMANRWPPPSPSPTPIEAPTHNSPPRVEVVECREIPSLAEAVEMTATAGIPQEFTEMVYRSWARRQGRDGAGVLVDWRGYVTDRWVREQVEWRAGTHRETRKDGRPVRSVANLVRDEKLLTERIATEKEKCEPNRQLLSKLIEERKKLREAMNK